MAKEGKRKTKLDELIADLRDKWGRDVIELGTDVKPVERTSTGILKLDKIIGGGWPKGRIIELWGPESSGKTTVAMYTIAAIQAANPDAIVPYHDLENTLDPEWAVKCGVDLARLWRIKAIPGEEVFDLIMGFVKQKWPLVVVDSIVEVIPEKELKKAAVDPQKVGAVATILAQNLPKVVILQGWSPTIVLITNQVRDKIGFMFGEGRKSPGGHALFHLDTIKLRIERKGKLLGDERKQIGIEVALKVVKSKVSREGAECRVGITGKDALIEDVTSVEEDSGGYEQ